MEFKKQKINSCFWACSFVYFELKESQIIFFIRANRIGPYHNIDTQQIDLTIDSDDFLKCHFHYGNRHMIGRAACEHTACDKEIYKKQQQQQNHNLRLVWPGKNSNRRRTEYSK